jgi:hypothetical protein
MDIEAVSEQYGGTSWYLCLHGFVQCRLRQVGCKKGNDRGSGGGGSRFRDLHAIRFGTLPALASAPQSDDDGVSAVLEVQGVRASLAAVTENRDSLALQAARVHVFFGIHLHFSRSPALVFSLPTKKKPHDPVGMRGLRCL